MADSLFDKLKEELHDDMEGLKTVRDELRIQMHLARKEAKDAWDGAEKRWEELERKLEGVKRQTEEPIHDIGEAAKNLLREIRDGYQKVRKAL